jgi:hypothetical protein
VGQSTGPRPVSATTTTTYALGGALVSGLTVANYVTGQSKSSNGPVDQPSHHQHECQPGLPFTVLHVQVDAEPASLVPVGGFPRCRPRHERRNVRSVSFVRFRESAGDIRPLSLHGRRVDQDEKCDHEKQQRPVGSDGEARRNHEAAEVERITCMGVWTGGGQPLVLGDMAGCPGAYEHPDKGDRPTDRERQRSGPGKYQIGNPKYEAER